MQACTKMLRIKLVYILLMLWLLLVGSTLLVTLLQGAGPTLLIFNLLLVLLVFFSGVLIFQNRELSGVAFIPLLFSAVQNIYLGVIAGYLTELQLAVMLIANVLYAVLTIIVLILHKPKMVSNTIPFTILIITCFLILYGLVTYWIFGGYLVSALASLRNILSPLIFFLLGTLLANRMLPERLYKYIAMLTWFILVFGLLERFFFPDLWQYLNIGELWPKKGISINSVTGLPSNFYAAEKIGEMYLRRMTASFADPVNLGTVLFFSLMISWFTRRKILACLCVLGIFLVISKGALLGLMIFSVVWAYYSKKRMVLIMLIIINGIAGLGFIFYSLNYATASLVTHVAGFFNAIKFLPDHLLGQGIGNVGVLAGLFSTLENTGIKESGLGMIIGQYGVIGLGIYVFFLWSIHSWLGQLTEIRSRVLSYSLFYAIILNIIFNEVALSPNSSAGYFTVLGCLCREAMKSKE